jgi:hypothetical protein
MLKRFKRIKIFFAVLILFLFFIFLASRGRIYQKNELTYGATFSKKQAQSLGLDWRKIYLSIFDDLKVSKIRLPAYWDEIEAQEGNFFWQDLDWQIEEAAKRGAEIILAAGARLPRWPECHFPAWTKGRLKAQIENKTLDYIGKVIERYKGNKQIAAWQIENEPFLSHFGDCPKFDKKFLDQEIALVKGLDKRPIVVTDSGELSVWLGAARRADIFGATLYRDTYSNFFKSYIHYPIRPGFFRFKRNIVGWFARPKDWIVIELQAEPWGPKPYQDLTQAERERTMNLSKFKDIIEFGRQAGFCQFYLWGAEWWYWEMAQGRPEVWNYARTLFSKS